MIVNFRLPLSVTSTPFRQLRPFPPSPPLSASSAPFRHLRPFPSPPPLYRHSRERTSFPRKNVIPAKAGTGTGTQEPRNFEAHWPPASAGVTKGCAKAGTEISHVNASRWNGVIPVKSKSAKNIDSNMQPTVYILASKRNGTLYVGVTSDLSRRVWEHRNDVIEGFTRHYGVHRLVYYEFHADMASAIIREKRVKKWNRAWKIELIERNNPGWDDLWFSIV